MGEEYYCLGVLACGENDKEFEQEVVLAGYTGAEKDDVKQSRVIQQSAFGRIRPMRLEIKKVNKVLQFGIVIGALFVAASCAQVKMADADRTVDSESYGEIVMRGIIVKDVEDVEGKKVTHYQLKEESGLTVKLPSKKGALLDKHLNQDVYIYVIGKVLERDAQKTVKVRSIVEITPVSELEGEEPEQDEKPVAEPDEETIGVGDVLQPVVVEEVAIADDDPFKDLPVEDVAVDEEELKKVVPDKPIPVEGNDPEDEKNADDDPFKGILENLENEE